MISTLLLASGPSRRYGPAWAAFDGKLPQLKGWPRHPKAPLELERASLLAEVRALTGEVSKLRVKVTRKQNGSIYVGQPSPMPRLLLAAEGKLESVESELRRRGSQA